MRRAGQSLRLLVVENEPLIAMFIEHVAQGQGWQIVGPALNLGQALELADTAFDGAVLDIHLEGGERSLPVAARLRQRGIPFMFATALDSPAERFGFEDSSVLLKPFGHQEFVTSVRTHLTAEG